MDKYRRVTKKDEDAAAPSASNEVRITQQGAVRSYVTYANGIFQDKKESKIVVKAMGNAISKAVTVAEVLKHRVIGLHQITQIGSIETVDVYEPLEEGLDRVEQKRRLPSIAITLSLETLDVADPGYQPPIAAELVTPQIDEKELPEKPQRQPKGDSAAKKKMKKKDKSKKDAAGAVAAEAGPPPSDRDEDKQVSAEDTKESGGAKPARGANSSKRGNRGGGGGRGRGRGGRGAAEGGRGGEERQSAGAEATPRAASVSPVRNTNDADTKEVDAPKKRAPRKKRTAGGDIDANKAAADRAAETTADSNNTAGEDAPSRENGGGRGRGRSGRGHGRGRGRGRGEGGRGDGRGEEVRASTDAAPAVVADA